MTSSRHLTGPPRATVKWMLCTETAEISTSIAFRRALAKRWRAPRKSGNDSALFVSCTHPADPELIDMGQRHLTEINRENSIRGAKRGISVCRVP